MMTKVAVYEREVANVVEIVGENLMVDVRGVQKQTRRSSGSIGKRGYCCAPAASPSQG